MPQLLGVRDDAEGADTTDAKRLGRSSREFVIEDHRDAGPFGREFHRKPDYGDLPSSELGQSRGRRRSAAHIHPRIRDGIWEPVSLLSPDAQLSFDVGRYQDSPEKHPKEVEGVGLEQV